MTYLRLFLAASWAVLFGACAGSDPKPFLGQWAVSGSYSGIVGDGGSAQPFNGASVSPTPGYRVTFAKGTSSDLLSLDTAGCALRWSISGDTATTDASPTCTFPNNGSPVVVAVTQGAIKLTVVDGTHLSGSMDLKGTCTDGSGPGPAKVFPCVAQAAGTFTKTAG